MGPPELDGFVILVQRLRQEQKPGHVARTVGKYTCFWNQVLIGFPPERPLAGDMVECGGPGNNGVLGVDDHLRIEQGVYPLKIQNGPNYQTIGYEEEDKLPGVLVGNTNERTYIIIHPCHNHDGYLSSIGCLNPAAELVNANSKIDYADSKNRVINLINEISSRLGGLPDEGVLQNCWLVIEGEPGDGEA